jgi:hypothetical protein
MPHWDGIISTASPQVLESCQGDPVAVHEKIMAAAPAGANVRAISWETGKDVAHVRVEGPNAEDFLKNTLKAQSVVTLVNAHERTGERQT